ncbi:Hypothetical predicted protein, partial [Olea europaea subsp. europaea]
RPHDGRFYVPGRPGILHEFQPRAINPPFRRHTHSTLFTHGAVPPGRAAPDPSA